jgi:hypothetical protein
VIELVEGFFVDPHAVTVIKAIPDSKCALWVTGQSALDGFVLDYPADEVAEAVADACEPEEVDAESKEED